MGILRRMGLVVASVLLPLLLFAAAIDIGVVRTAVHPKIIKRVLADSGIYKSVVPNALDQAKEINNGNNQISLTDPTVRAAAEKTFSPQYVQQSTEQVLDGIYHWLDGKVPQPDFHIDLNERKAAFAEDISQAAQQRAASLPACTTAITASSFDAFSATCLPRGLTPAAVATQVKSTILNGQGFLETGVISANSVKNSDSNQSVFRGQLKQAPQKYQRAKDLPPVLVLLSLLAAAGMVFLSATRRAGVRHLGIILVTVAVLMLVFAWTLNPAINNQVMPKIKVDNAVLQTVLKKLIRDISQSVDKNYWWFGGIYTALGAAAIAGAVFIGRGPVAQPAAATESATPDTKPVKKTSKPKSIKVQ